MSYIQILSCSLFISVVAIGCGPQGLDGDSEKSDLHFITFGRGVSGLVAKVKQPKMSVCLSGAVGNSRERWTNQIQDAVMKWIQPMRAFTKDPLVQQVEVRNQATGCDARVVVHGSVHANTRIGSNPTVNMAAAGHFGSYGVLLHEFGHAFALGDTYVPGGSSGQCQSGQPQSVMCNVSFKEPQSDDIKGLKVVYDRVFPNDEPGEEPDPNLQTRLFMALSDASNGKAFLFIGAVDRNRQVQDLGQVLYCFGGKGTCQGESATWITTQRAKIDRDVGFYRSPDPIQLQDGQEITVLFKHKQQEKAAFVRLSRRG